MSDEQDIIELESIIDRLEQKKTIFKHKILIIDEEIRCRNQMLCDIKQKVNLNSVIDYVKHKDKENIITDVEIQIIYDGMDKTDYGDKYDRWFDLNKLINRIINLKNKYRDLNLVLKKVTQLMSEDRLPPINSYNLQFITDDKERIIFNL
jgi:hypothetical protein